MALFKIPLVNNPQSFLIELAGVTYQMTCKWNDADEAGWVLDLADEGGNSIVANLALVTGVDILSGLEYLGIGGQLIVHTDGDDDAVPTFENLGVESNLYFDTDGDSVTTLGTNPFGGG